MAAERTRSAPALERGILIIERLATSHHGLTLSQLTRYVELPKSSVHCLLLTIERSGYIQRDDKGRYRLGLRLFDLANSALAHLTLQERATPCLLSLVEKTQVTAHMAVLEHGEALLIAKFDPPGLPQLATWIGKRMGLHCTAVGKVLLAYLPDEEVNGLVKKYGLLRHNENTITSMKRLNQELEMIRRRGYSLDDEEEEIGVRCIGAPVLDWRGCALAAISVTGRTSQVDNDTIPTLATAVKQTAASVVERLSSSPPGVGSGALVSQPGYAREL